MMVIEWQLICSGKSWQRKWNEENTGRFTYSLIPEVSSKVLFPKERDVGVSYCRMLLHDTLLNDDGFRTGISVTPQCSCGEDKESVEHVLLHCSKYITERTVMIDTLTDIWMCSSKYKKWNLDITESLLLAPYSDNVDYTRQDSRNIKEALFEFLACIDLQM